MPRTKGFNDISEIKRGALIEVKNTSNIFNRQLAKRYRCDKKTIANVLKRAEEAEKEILTHYLQKHINDDLN